MKTVQRIEYCPIRVAVLSIQNSRLFAGYCDDDGAIYERVEYFVDS